MSRVTIKDIAKKLAISPSTVSRALRDHPDISKDTKALVSRIADQLDYFPDSLAQGLKSRKTNTIGLIVPEIKHHFFSSAISGIEDIAYTAGYTILVCQSNEDVEREKTNLKALVSNRIAGLLVSISQTTQNMDHFQILKKRGIPVVFFDRTLKGMPGCKVVVDDCQGAYKAVTHLIEKGYRRIAHIAGPENISIGQDRFDGYCKALADHKVRFDETLVVRTGFRQADGSAAIDRILNLRPKPDAIFAVNDPVAIGAFIRLKEKKIKIPQDMALVGFSNNPISALIDPPLTTVAQPSYEIGQAAAKLLLEQISHGGKPEHHSEHILKTRLIVRESS